MTNVTPAFTPDQSGWIAVAALLFSCWSICTISVRAYIRRTGHGPWGTDDTALLVSQIFAVLCSVLAIVAARQGYGNVIPSASYEDSLKVTYVSQLLYMASNWACKCSAALLISRLAPPGPINRVSFGIVGSATVWAFVSILIMGLRGNMSQPWLTIDGSVSMYQRWLAIEIVGMAIEVALFVTVFTLFIPLQLTDGTMKPVLIASFATRLFIIPIAAVRLHYLYPYNLSTFEAGRNFVIAGALAQAVMHYSLISASIPCLKPFMRPFDNSTPQRILDDQHLDPTRTRALGGGNLFMYGPTPPINDHKPSGTRSPNRSGGSGKNVFQSIRNSVHFPRSARDKPHLRQSLRSLTLSNGDSNFRPDRDMGSVARVATLHEELEMNPIGHDLPPVDNNQLLIRHTTDWTVSVTPVDGQRQGYPAQHV